MWCRRVGSVVVGLAVCMVWAVGVWAYYSLGLVNPGFELDFEGWWCGDAGWCAGNQIAAGYVGKGWFRGSGVGGWNLGALCQPVELYAGSVVTVSGWCRRSAPGSGALYVWLVDSGGQVWQGGGSLCGTTWGQQTVSRSIASSGVYTLCVGSMGDSANQRVDEIEAWQSVGPTATPTATPTAAPTVTPTATPTAAPTVTPTAAPTVTPTVGRWVVGEGLGLEGMGWYVGEVVFVVGSFLVALAGIGLGLWAVRELRRWLWS